MCFIAVFYFIHLYKYASTMKKLKGNGVKALKAVHFLFAFMWIGGALSMTLLLLTTAPQESYEMYMRSLSLKQVDDWLIIPGAMGCLATGIVYGVWTHWGFFKHRWVTVKWGLTIAMILLGTFLMGPWVNGNVYAPADIADYTRANTEFFHNVSQTILWGSIQLILLLGVIVISVFKPWKTIKQHSAA